MRKLQLRNSDLPPFEEAWLFIAFASVPKTLPSTYRKIKNRFPRDGWTPRPLAGGSVTSEWPSDQLMGTYVYFEENLDLAQI
jgi:hypothetical protein